MLISIISYINNYHKTTQTHPCYTLHCYTILWECVLQVLTKRMKAKNIFQPARICIKYTPKNFVSSIDDAFILRLFELFLEVIIAWDDNIRKTRINISLQSSQHPHLSYSRFLFNTAIKLNKIRTFHPYPPPKRYQILPGENTNPIAQTYESSNQTLPK